MRAKGFTALLAAAVLAALAGWTMVEPISTGVYAQAAPAQGGRERRPQVLAARRLPEHRARAADGARRRRSSGRRPASSRWPSTCSRRRTSTRTGRTGSTSATTAATTRASSTRCGIRAASVPSRRSPRRGATATTTLPRERIVSPYAYKTAKEHYEALLAQAKAKGGPTVYTKATVPDWDGYYARDNMADTGSQWIWGVAQLPTVLSVLTPEYQKRLVQSAYHEAVSNAPQWSASFCWPEGFTRWWAQPSQAGNFQLTMTPWNVQFLSGHRRQLPASGDGRQGRRTCTRCRSGTARRSGSGTGRRSSPGRRTSRRGSSRT